MPHDQIIDITRSILLNEQEKTIRFDLFEQCFDNFLIYGAIEVI